MHVYIDFVSISRVTSSCSISLNVGIVICIVSSVSVRPVNKIAKKKKKKSLEALLFFSFNRFLGSRKVSSQGQASAVYKKRCDEFILWEIVEVCKCYFKCR